MDCGPDKFRMSQFCKPCYSICPGYGGNFDTCKSKCKDYYERNYVEASTTKSNAHSTLNSQVNDTVTIVLPQPTQESHHSSNVAIIVGVTVPVIILLLVLSLFLKFRSSVFKRFCRTLLRNHEEQPARDNPVPNVIHVTPATDLGMGTNPRHTNINGIGAPRGSTSHGIPTNDEYVAGEHNQNVTNFSSSVTDTDDTQVYMDCFRHSTDRMSRDNGSITNSHEYVPGESSHPLLSLHSSEIPGVASNRNEFHYTDSSSDSTQDDESIRIDNFSIANYDRDYESGEQSDLDNDDSYSIPSSNYPTEQYPTQPPASQVTPSQLGVQTTEHF